MHPVNSPPALQPHTPSPESLWQQGTIPCGLEAAASFSLGIATAHWIAAPVLAAAALALWFRGKVQTTPIIFRLPAAKPCRVKIAWLFVLLCLGWIRATSAVPAATPLRSPGLERRPNKTSPAHPNTLSGSVTGTICNIPVLRQRKYSSDRAPVRYADFSILEEGSSLPIRVEAEIAPGQLPEDIKPGARVKVLGKLRFPTGSRKNTPYAPTIHSFADSLSFLPTTRGTSLPPVLQLRWKIIRTIDQLYSSRSLGFFHALITGEKRSLDRQLHLDFLDTGTSHFLAISGLHVGLVMLFAMRIPFPRRIQLAMRLLLLCGFALISGANTPVLRAALMIGLHMTLKASARRPRPLDTLGWTLIILLAIAPPGLSQPGFQLSFIATAAILWWHSIRERESRRLQSLTIPAQRFSKRKRPLASLAGMIGKGLSIGLISTAATTPLIAEYFQRFHPLSPLLSLCLYPLVALSLILGLISVLLGMACLPLGQLAAQPAILGAQLLFELLRFFTTLPGHCYYLPPPGPTPILLFYLVLACGMSKKTRKAAVMLAMLILPVLLVFNLLSNTGSGPVLTHFNTRAGSAALLEIPSRKKTFLLDACGGTPAASQRLLHSILKAGHRRIDGVFLTHPHADHAGALPLLTESLEVGEIFCSSHFGLNKKGRRLLEGVRKKGIPLTTINRGVRLDLAGTGEINLRVIFPCGTETLPLRRAANDISLSFFLESKRRRILFLGDLEEDGLARLFGSGEELRSDVLVLPHHGRTNRLNDLLLTKVQPQVVVISGDGRGGALEFSDRLEQSGTETYSTWRGGNIRQEWTDSGIATGYQER